MSPYDITYDTYDIIYDVTHVIISSIYINHVYTNNPMFNKVCSYISYQYKSP